MTIKQQIPEIEGIVDEKTIVILRSIKNIIDGITGNSIKPIVKLGSNATLAGTINKINEIIAQLQSERKK